MLSVPRNNTFMSKNIRTKVCKNFSYKIISKKYKIYEKNFSKSKK